MKRFRIWARIPLTITLAMVTGVMCATGVWWVAGVYAGGQSPTGTTGKGPGNATLGKPGAVPAKMPPAYGIQEDDDEVLLVDQPGKLTSFKPGTHRVIALDLPGSQLRQEGVPEKLIELVQKDGVYIWTHTDAAALFGFRLQAPRNALELLGRSVIVPPWNGHLFTQGVRRVYYTMKENSQYVTTHPQAIMLLRNTDNPNPAQRGRVLFVGAYLPLGKGAVFFLPPYIQTRRGESGAFFQAIRKYCTGDEPAAAVASSELETVGNMLIQAGRDRTGANVQRAVNAARSHVAIWTAQAVHQAGDKEATTTALERAVQIPEATPEVHRAAARIYNELGDRTRAQAELQKAGPPPQQEPEAGPTLLIGLPELEESANVFAGQIKRNPPPNPTGKAPPPPQVTPLQAAAAIAQVWRGRLIAQYGDSSDNLNRADRLFQEAIRFDEGSPQANQYHAFVLATVGRNSRLASPQRARYLQEAMQFLARAFPEIVPSRTTSAPTATGKGKQPPAKAPTGKSGGAGGDDGTAGGAGDQAKWLRDLEREAEIASAEPPILDVRGNLLVRTTPGDSALTAFQAITVARESADRLGLYVDEAEILSFLSQPAYTRYMVVASAPRGEYELIAGIVDNKVVTYVQATGGLVGKFGQGRALALAPIMGHLYGHAVIASLTEGGSLLPGWMVEGISAMVEPQLKNPLPILRQAQSQRLMFSAADLERPIDSAADTDDRRLVFQAQSHSLTDFLVRSSPPGTLYRLLQEIGSGKTADEALQAILQISYEDLYRLWAQRVMGVRA